MSELSSRLEGFEPKKRQGSRECSSPTVHHSGCEFKLGKQDNYHAPRGSVDNEGE